MDSNDNTSSQRKRTSRPSKGSNETTATTSLSNESPECTDVAALAISPTPEGRPNPTIIPVSECRRSSRKKIIKFDVRDLLNKNRKPHKIQIEARIDSNVPSTTKPISTTSGESTSKNPGPNSVGPGDLSSKQKTFMEKSAIFRRFSISQEQSKPPPPPIPLPPTILNKVGDGKDTTGNTGSSGKRVNRTQDYYSNVMLKPKQTTSLIVAQMESNVRSTDTKSKSSKKEIEAKNLDNQDIEVVPQQKRRGRPPKIRTQDSVSGAAENEESTTTSLKGKASSQKLTPEKATNWKEYKACLAQQSTATTSDVIVDNQSTVSEDAEQTNPKGPITTASEDSTSPNDSRKDCSESSGMKQFGFEKIDDVEKIVCTKQDLAEKRVVLPENNRSIAEPALTIESKPIEISLQDDDRNQSKNEHPQISSDDGTKDLTLDTPLVQKNLGQELSSVADDSINKSQIDKEAMNISTTKDVVTNEKSIILSRASSLSESEYSDRSSVSVLTSSSTVVQKNVGKGSPKDTSTVRISNNTDQKIPVTKRSKRLQRKNNRSPKNVGETKDSNEPPTTSDEISKPSNEHNLSEPEDNQLVTVESLTEETSQSIIVPKAVNENLCSTSYTHEQNVFNETENPNTLCFSENKCKGSQKSAPKQTVEENCHKIIEKDTLEKDYKSKESSEEKIDQPIEKDILEYDKKEANSSQKSSMPKMKEKGFTKQRKSLRNCIETNSCDIDKDIHKQLVETPKDVMVAPKQTSKFHVDDDVHKQVEETTKVGITAEQEAPEMSGNISQKMAEQQLQETMDKNQEDNIKVTAATGEQLGMFVDCANVDVSQSIGVEESDTLQSTTSTNIDDSHIATEDNKDPDPNSFTNAIDIVCKIDHGNEHDTPDKSSTKKLRQVSEKPTLSKRKSLRIQKDISPERDNCDNLIGLIEQPSITSQEEGPPIHTNFVEDLAVVPKRKPRKSRFKNLHDPDTEMELNVTKSSAEEQLITHVEPKSIENEIVDDTSSKYKTGIDEAHKATQDANPIKDNFASFKLSLPEISAPLAALESVKTLEDNNIESANLVDEIKEIKDLSAILDIPSTSQTESNNYVIKNVSIETNTLLDILRTVQSNKEAAEQVEAKKTCDSVSAVEVENTFIVEQQKCISPTQVHGTYIADQEVFGKDTDLAREVVVSVGMTTVATEMHDSVNVQSEKLTVSEPVPELPSFSVGTVKATVSKDGESSKTSDTTVKIPEYGGICNTNQENQAKDMKLKKKLVDISSTSNSPKRCSSASPLPLKKTQHSPSRSDTSSPSTFKKVNISPSRSDTSSPSTFNKKFTTRRYERRSRRGDEESSHKTLEETFAEIAALSSKAVLEMSNTESEGLTDGDSVAPNDNRAIEEEKKEKEKLAEVNVSSSLETPLNELEIQETITATPTRKTRARSVKVQSPISVNKVSKDISQENINKKEQDPEITLEDIEIKSTNTSQEIEQNDIQNNESCKNSDSTSTPFDTATDNKSNNPEALINIVKDEVSINLPDNSLSVAKKIDELSAIVEKEESERTTGKLILNSEREVIETDKVEESENANELKFKRNDSLFNKSDSKSSIKKSSKKGKHLENVESAKTEDSTTIKTTTPPPKRSRKSKTSQLEDPNSSNISSSANKKKQIKDQSSDEKKEDESPKVKNDFDSDSKSYEDKLAKKKRQRKLKEAFEAALKDNIIENTTELKDIETLTPVTTPASSPTFGLSLLNRSPPLETESVMEKNIMVTAEATDSAITGTQTEPEEDPDPLKDIEKFIEDGVNLLKKGYKIDEDSVDNVLPSKSKENEQQETEIKSDTQNDLSANKETVFSTFETPVDTPLTTPNITPPPKSPELAVNFSEEQQSSGGVRRSHRIKLITKTPKALVGRGLVRDKERFSIKDDVETKSHYTLDDHLLDLAEVEAKNAKFLKEMEERLSNFHVIKENEYKCERVISKEARKMICDCFLTPEEEERGELACGEDCLNRLLMIECGSECNVKERCTNKRFQKYLCSPCRVFRTEKKGFGIMADIEILPGEFIMEYVGEVINTEEFERRRFAYSQEKNRHYYFMALRSDAIIDATIKGNISRFINHSCDPNAETQKWTVNGELRIGFFSRKSIMPGEEITFDYQYQRYGREAQRCYCESANCRGWIGQEPNSDEGEQMDDEDESDDEDDDEEDTPNLLVEDDEDSDASVSDPEEVQKKLEMAAAQAEAELLTPITLTLDEKPGSKEKEQKIKENEQEECTKISSEEDSKSKFKKLLSKMAEKVAAKQKQSKKEQKLQRKKKSKESSSDLANKQRSLEDPDIEDEVEFLSRCGLKTQSDTLRLSRLMVRAKLVQTRLNLLEILRKGELPCRRLFLDYHGLRLVHGWMSEEAGNMQIRLALLQTLELLPIANKTVLTDSKVMQVVRNWCGSNSAITSPGDDSLSSNSNSQDGTMQVNTSENNSETSECVEVQKLALKLVTRWDGLPEIFRIPKKERIEQMKEHEREADRQYAETEADRHSNDRYGTNRFGRRFNTTTSRFVKPHNSKLLQQQNNGNTMRTPITMTPDNTTQQSLSKTQRREMFAAKVARDEAEKRMAEERREFETKCRFFGLDPKKTRPQDVPFCVNPATGQWYSIERKPINTPPSYAHVQVPVKPKSTNPNDYQLPTACSTLPPQWKFAITPLGQIYYYHIQYRVPQWTPPSPAQLQLCEMAIDDVDSGNEHTPTTGPDSSDDDDDILIGMDTNQLKAYIDKKVEIRRQKRYQRLVDERAISPRREEDRIYNQLEVRKYKENKEKIRKRKEEIRRRRAEALRQTSLNMCTLGSLTDSIASTVKSEADDGCAGVLPIQDYLLSSDEDDDIKVEVNSPLIDKIVEGDKIVDELDALTTKRQLKRPLPPHRDLNESSPCSSSSTSAAALNAERQEYKKRKMEKKDKRKPKEQDAKYRRTKEKFRCEIAGIIVHHLKPYRKDSCTVGRIKCNEDFNHLARKLTHFVMIKELKYCESVGQTLVVTESVKNKSREFIKKYMAKYGDFYVKPANDPEFKDIPFTL